MENVLNDKNVVDESIFYDGFRLLTHNCLFNFIIGERGCGKTFWFKWWAIKDFIDNGNQFAYVRRYKPALMESMKTFFQDIAFKFPGHSFRVEGKTLYIDDKIAGYGFTLSTGKTFKSVSYPLINKMAFDEFLIEPGNLEHYLTDEVGSFLNLYETIARPGSGHVDVVVVFLSNAITWTNPYFIHFNVRKPKTHDKNGKLIGKNGEVLIELTEQLEFREAKRTSRYGSIINGSIFADYSIENKFLLDDETFIEHKGKNARYFFTLRYMNKEFGVWIDYTEGKIWVSDDIDPSFKFIIAITLKDQRPNTLYLKGQARKGHLKEFIEAFKNGNVYYENINLKNLTYEMIKICLSA